MSWPYGLKQPTLSFQENPRIQWSHVVPVPQTDSGGRGENPQALERTLARNSANFHRNFGRRWAASGEGTCSWSPWRSQRNGGSDCLPKTQDSANSKEEV